MDAVIFDAYERVKHLLGTNFLYETEEWLEEYKIGFCYYVILPNDSEGVLAGANEEIKTLCEIIAQEMFLEVDFIGPRDDRGYNILYIRFNI